MDKIKILIIDDSYRFIKSAVNFLDLHEGIEILGGAISNEVGLKMTSEMKPDLILLDLSVPDYNGLDLLKKLKEINPCLKVIITTIEESDGYKEMCLLKGADDFISKSDFGNKVVPAIHNLFNFAAK